MSDEELPRVHLKVREDRTGLTLRVSDPEGATLTAENVSALIEALIEVRLALAPPVEFSDPLPGQPVKYAVAPRWFVAPQAGLDKLLLLLMPSLGWVGMPLEREGCEALVNALMAVPRPEPAPRPN